MFFLGINSKTTKCTIKTFLWHLDDNLIKNLGIKKPSPLFKSYDTFVESILLNPLQNISTCFVNQSDLAGLLFRSTNSKTTFRLTITICRSNWRALADFKPVVTTIFNFWSNYKGENHFYLVLKILGASGCCDHFGP